MPFSDLLRPSRQADRNGQEEDPACPSEEVRNATLEESTRRVIGYYNALDEDKPPHYDDISTPITNELSHVDTHIPPRPQHERPPDYNCSVTIEGCVGLRIERINPFDSIRGTQWTDVYVRLQGTMLAIHTIKKTKSAGFGQCSELAGKLIRKYTLQHGEIGLASDLKKIELVPRSAITQMLGENTLRQLRETEPQLFMAIKQYPLRLRLETDQFLLRFKSSEDRMTWMQHFCAAIDIAPPLDLRTEPRYHTLPRRRRRNLQLRLPTGEVDLTNASLVLEQQATIRAYFPQLFSSTIGIETGGPSSGVPMQDDSKATPVGGDPDAEELDNSFMVTASRNSDPTSDLQRVESRVSSCESPTNEDAPWQKWCPETQIDLAREERYRRRCTPALVYNSRRANDTLISNGTRMIIDWENKTLKAHPSVPPPYVIPQVDINFAKVGIRQRLKQSYSSPNNNLERSRRADAEACLGEPRGVTAFKSSNSQDTSDTSSNEIMTASMSASWKGVSSWTAKVKRKASRPDLKTSRSEAGASRIFTQQESFSDAPALPPLPDMSTFGNNENFMRRLNVYD